MDVMLCFGLAGIFIALGVFLRSKIKPLRNMLVPATVIGGFIGCIFMNCMEGQADIGVSYDLCTTIVGYLFTLSFIALGLSKSDRVKSAEDGGGAKSVAKASIAISTVWSVCLSLQACLGIVIISIFGGAYGMDPMYGILIPFGFCEGPGSAATYAAMFERYGWSDATPVAVTFAVAGFIGAFAIGVPIAKYGIKKKLAKNAGKMNDSVAQGYFPPEEQRESLGKVTMHAGSVDTLTFHLALVVLVYVMALGLAKLFSFIPGFVGETLSGLVFMSGMICAVLVRMVMDKLKISYLLSDALLSKFTGFMTDFLIVFAFMAVQLSVVQKWLVPLAIECVIVSFVCLGVCLFFGSRMGGDNDFERTIGVFGACSGTTPNGIALIRIVDPKMKTPSIMELGLMNLPATVYLAIAGTVILGAASGTYSYGVTIAILLGLALGMIILAYVTKSFGKRTYGFSKKWIEKNNREAAEKANISVQGKLNIQ